MTKAQCHGLTPSGIRQGRRLGPQRYNDDRVNAQGWVPMNIPSVHLHNRMTSCERERAYPWGPNKHAHRTNWNKIKNLSNGDRIPDNRIVILWWFKWMSLWSSCYDHEALPINFLCRKIYSRLPIGLWKWGNKKKHLLLNTNLSAVVLIILSSDFCVSILVIFYFLRI